VPLVRIVPSANPEASPLATANLLTVAQTAQTLGVSQSWVRRHKNELPIVALGRLIRFDADLLSRQLQDTIADGKSLKPGRRLMISRYQRGSVRLLGKSKVWYGTYREDVKTPDGQIERRQRQVRLGTLAELPTKNAARNKLSDMLRNSNPTTEMTFRELSERWEKAEGPTLKPSTLSHYHNALRAYVLPAFGSQTITKINREAVQTFLAKRAATYSASTLRSMRIALSLTLGWAKSNHWVPSNPCEGVRLPQATGGRKVMRTALSGDEIASIAQALKEPYATLVLFLAATGLRIGEGLAIKWTDFRNNVLHVTRRLYDGDVDTVKSRRSERKLPIDPLLMARLDKLGKGEWVFRSRTGTPLNPGNVLKRQVRPAAKKLGISLGGWHDFRHTFSTKLRRSGVHPKVVSDLLGHKRVNLAMDVYDRTDVQDFVQPLAAVAENLLQSVTKTEVAA
jgi:integrase